MTPPVSPVRHIRETDLTDKTKAGGKALASPPSNPCKPSLSTKADNTLTDKADLTDKTGEKKPLRIVVDSREQAPFRLEGYSCTVEVGTLASGDYSLRGFTDRIGVERKSLPDLVACLSVERERFARELSRLRVFDAACVVVEAPAHELRAGHYRSQLNPEAGWQSVLAFSMRYRIPFIWCQDRADAEKVTFDFLRHYERDRRRELSALWDGEKSRLAGTPPVRARA